MARKTRKLIVLYTTSARLSLDEIWDWNARTYSRDHANRYIAFLRGETDKLETEYLDGRIIPSRPELRHVTIRRNPRGHGHIAVYEVVDDVVYVLDYFYTSEDWESKVVEAY